MYVHELQQWPKFVFDEVKLGPLLVLIRDRLQSLSAELANVGFEDQTEALLRSLTSEVVKTSEIEGEKLDPALVRSSIAAKLGLAEGGIRKVERDVEGIVSVVLDATQKCDESLTEERLFGWHSALFPTGWSDMAEIIVGGWRDDSTGPMQVVSGRYGNRKVHFEAPSHSRLIVEMSSFLDWFNQNQKLDLFLKAGIAHFYFVTIHPFADGNGRIARSICDLMLARADRMSQRYYSMSAQINHDKVQYYAILEVTQKGTLDITEWLEWFLNCLIRSMNNAEIILRDILLKARVWESLKTQDINERQKKVLNSLLDNTFIGALSASKYASINKCSPDTANRDLKALESFGVLERTGSGKATRYTLHAQRFRRHLEKIAAPPGAAPSLPIFLLLFHSICF